MGRLPSINKVSLEHIFYMMFPFLFRDSVYMLSHFYACAHNGCQDVFVVIQVRAKTMVLAMRYMEKLKLSSKEIINPIFAKQPEIDGAQMVGKLVQIGRGNSDEEEKFYFEQLKKILYG